MRSTNHWRTKRAVLTLGAGVLASLALSLATSGTLAGFTAQITNSADSAATGYLVMQESNAAGTVTCNSNDPTPGTNTINTNAATCSTINKYGGSTTMVPGTAVNTTVTVKNTGTVSANTFTLTPGTCTQSNNGTVNGSAIDLCAKINLTLTQTVSGTTTTIINNVALSTAAGTTYTLATPVTAGQTISFTFSVTLAAAAGNTYQGLAASQPLVWQFVS